MTLSYERGKIIYEGGYFEKAGCLERTWLGCICEPFKRIKRWWESTENNSSDNGHDETKENSPSKRQKVA